jgi:RHS repeat-associated protein
VWFIAAEDAVLDNFGGGTVQGGQGFTHGRGNTRNRIAGQEKDPNPYDVELTNAELFWQGIPLGSELTTKVTFTQLDKSATRQKPQSNGMWGEDIVQIMYDVPNHRIQVWKFEGKAWVQVGNDIPVKFVDGDVFTVFAGKDGTVEITRNGRLLSTRQPAVLQTPTPTVTETPIQKDASASELANFAPVSLKLPAPVSAPQQQSGSVTINYVYDPLYRLTQADYSTGDYYHYAYDAVGNRLTETTQLATTSYQYDVANRLTSVDGINYTWDNNGNLLNDGVNTYTYDPANRLVSFNGQGVNATYIYNGMGDRLSQTVNSNTTTYTLDLNTGLTQVLNDGTNTYLYGNGRIAQVNTTTEYFLGDALGSVRQLTDATGDVTLAKSYQPYGETLASAGNGSSPFAFTGEQQDASGLTYLRARYYAGDTGRFLTRDTWMGDYNSPLSLNRWMYVEGNPINYVDPTGYVRKPCVLLGGWDSQSVIARVDEAEKYVTRTSDPIDTYVAAGIAIQCAGYDRPFSSYSGLGIAQITRKQAEIEWGKEIKDIFGRFRGYGLRWRCPDGELEEELDPLNTQHAVILMKREIQLVLGACGSKCTDTDKYIAAALAQNGPGFSYMALRKLPNMTSDERNKHDYDPDIKKNWFLYFRDDAEDGDMVNTKTQLKRFILVVNELKRRSWIVPNIVSATIEELQKIGR